MIQNHSEAFFGGFPVIILVAGFAIVAAGLCLVFVCRRRLRKARKERPPQQEKLLRPPGHSLALRISQAEEADQNATLRCVAAGGIFALLASLASLVAADWLAGDVSLSGLANKIGWAQLLITLFGTVVSVGWLAHEFRSVIRSDEKLRHLRFGLRGEQAVAEALTTGEISRAGYTAFHDVPGDGPWNIDHVAIGPGGVFAIETKARSRRKATRNQEEHKVFFDGTTLRFPWCENHEAAAQARRNASWLGDFIRAFAPGGLVVVPILVLPGWWVETTGNFPVKAMNAKYLKKFLCNSEIKFTPEQLKMAVALLDKRCRDVEF